MLIENGWDMMTKELKLVIDNDILDKYNAYYFRKHPKAKKKPIEKPTIPSLNTWIILPRIQMNALKQKHKDFIIWVIRYYGYENMKLENFEMEFTVYMPTKRRSDNDNFIPKFWLDGFTESGFIVDDDNKHLTKLVLMSGYDKDNPRTEIVIKIN